MKSLFNPLVHNRFRSNNSGAAGLGGAGLGGAVNPAALRTVRANATMSAGG